jgi:hypothetical protein
LAKWKVFVVGLIGTATLIFNGESFFPNISEDTGSSRLTEFIPRKDRKRLEYFFRRFMFWEEGGYVLVGNKPCSIAVLQDPTYFHLGFLCSLMPSNLRFWLGWKTWKKYEKHFTHPCFSFLKEDLKNGSSLIIFINKNGVLNAISSHKVDFETTLQQPIEPTQILDEAESNSLFSEVLKGNEFLIGILLGFGRGNSWLYYSNHQSASKAQRLASFVDPDEHKRFANYIASQGSWAFTSGALFRNLSELPLPGFSVDPSSLETMYLKKLYLANRQKIIEEFDQKNFLDVTLELLTRSAVEVVPFERNR